MIEAKVVEDPPHRMIDDVVKGLRAMVKGR
jgi:hypothetical protein